MFNDANVFPKSLFVVWDYFFGFTEAIGTRSAVMLGEWGGTYNTGPDITWQNTLGKFFLLSLHIYIYIYIYLYLYFYPLLSLS